MLGLRSVRARTESPARFDGRSSVPERARARQPRWRALWSMAAAAALVVLYPLASSAQAAYPQRDADDAAYSSSWQHLQDLSVQLENLSHRVRDEARIDSRHHGSGALAGRMDDFAKDAHEFRELMSHRNVKRSDVDDHIRKLVEDARKVQQESARADRHDPRTDADWNRAVAVLDRINDQSFAANGLRTGPIGTSGEYRAERDYRGWADSRRTIVTDLDRRVDDAARLSESANLEVAPEFDRLRDQVRSFQQGMDNLSPVDTRANIAHMLADARAAQADLAGSNAPAQLRDDVNAIVGMLVNMRDMTAEGTAGTNGYGAPPPMARDRYETMDLPDLTRDLDTRVSRATQLATQGDYDQVSNDVAHFQDRLRDFEDRSADMSLRERHEAVDSLLKDAQNTQREIARRHVSADFANEWNGIVDLLARMDRM